MIRKLADVFLGVLARWREFRGARLIRRDSRHPNVLLGPGARILGNCQIGAGVVVYDHTKLKDCTVGRHLFRPRFLYPSMHYWLFLFGQSGCAYRYGPSSHRQLRIDFPGVLFSPAQH